MGVSSRQSTIAGSSPSRGKVSRWWAGEGIAQTEELVAVKPLDKETAGDQKVDEEGGTE